MNRIILFFILLAFITCNEKEIKYKCPPYDNYEEPPYNNPVWHPSGKIIGFNHIPLKEINYINGIECPLQASFAYEQDSIGFWLINSDGTNQRRVLPYYLIGPAWSPDGNWIAFSRSAQVCIMPFDGVQFDTTAIVQLTDEGRNFFPAWSPDGQWIAYDSDKDSPTGLSFIWKMRKNGTEKKRIAFTPNDGETRAPYWGNDFKIVHERYIRSGTGTTEIFTMDSSGNNVVRLTENGTMDVYPKPSPDNLFICYVSYSKLGLWRINLKSNEINLLTEYCCNFSWSPEGKIVYVNYDNPRMDETKGALWIMDPDGNNKYPLTYNTFKLIQ